MKTNNKIIMFRIIITVTKNQKPKNMKIRMIISAFIIITIVMMSCGGSRKDAVSDSQKQETSSEKSKDDDMLVDEEEYSVQSSATPSGARNEGGGKENQDDFSKMVSSSAAQLSRHDSIRKLIRTAELKFRAVDVVETSYKIEDIVKLNGGFVESTYLRSEITNTETTRVSTDSLLESVHYELNNDIVFRVPVENLDTTLKSIAPMIEFLDYRNVKAEDVSLTYLRKQLEKKRLDLYNIQVSGLTTSGTNGDRLAAMESQLEKQIQNDESMLERLEMDDKVRYATVSLHIYGREKVKNTLLPDQQKTDSYKPGFGRQLIDALERGWTFLNNLIMALVSIWPLWLAAAVVWIVIKRYKRRNKE